MLFKGLRESNHILLPQEPFKQQPITLETKGSKNLHDNYVRYLKGLTSEEAVKQNWPDGFSRSEDNACYLNRANKISNKKEYNSEHLSFL